jgi:hypothetical protein
MVAVLDKRSEFAERAVHEWSADVFRDDDTALAGQYRLMIRTEREKAWEKKKHDTIEPAHWTQDQIAELDAEYAAYRRRGDEPRFWEDFAEGDPIGPMVKGPLLVTDMVCWHGGIGMGLYDVDGSRGSSTPTTRASPTSCNACAGTPNGPAGPGTRPPTTTAASAGPGWSTSAPTGWVTTPGSGSSGAPSALQLRR